MPSADEGHGSIESQHNFTPRAQQALALAHKEADRFHHNFVGTEHLLLGIIWLGQGVAVNVLQKMGVDLEVVRLEVEKQVGAGPEQVILGNIPYTPRLKKVLALATREAKALHHTYVGTEHLLLGLLGEGDGVAARVLKELEVNIDLARQEILHELDPNFGGTARGAELPPSSTAPTPARSPVPLNAQLSKPQRDSVDTSKRYDVYCTEPSQGIVVYRNAHFKSIKCLFPKPQHGILSEFVELEQEDGQTIFVARSSVIKFCEHRARPGSDAVPGTKP